MASRSASLSGCPPVTLPVLGTSLKTPPFGSIVAPPTFLFTLLPCGSPLVAVDPPFAFPCVRCSYESHRTLCAGDDGSTSTSRVLRSAPGLSIEPFCSPVCRAASLCILLVFASTLMLQNSRQRGVRLVDVGLCAPRRTVQCVEHCHGCQSSRIYRIENLPAPASSLLPGIGIFVRAMMAHSNL